MLDEILQAELNELKQNNLYRTLRRVRGPTGPTINIDGREFVQLSSNNYLGLANHPKLVEAAKAALEKYGTGSGASRLISGNNELYEELETRLAEFKRTEGALVFATGYMANLGTITSLAGTEDLVVIDKLNHASIIDACRQSGAKLRVYPHKNVNRLAEILSASKGFRRRLVITDGVFSMDGDLAPLPEIVEVVKRHDAILMVDDAHGSFVLGESGRGTIEHFGLEGKIPIQMGTFSKALGSLGGYIAGSKALIEYLKNKARSLIYSTALPASVLAASIAALDLVKNGPELRARLWENVNFFKNGLEHLKYDIIGSETQIIPILIGGAEESLTFSQALFDNGIYAPAVRPPTVPRNSSRIRTSVIASHTREHLEKALDAFERCRGV